MMLRRAACLAVLCPLAASTVRAEERHIYTMYCNGNGIAFDSKGNAVTVIHMEGGKMSTDSVAAERVEHVNGFVAVDASKPGTPATSSASPSTR